MEKKQFYESDEKLYELSKNGSFLSWLNENVLNGYQCFINIDELQELINLIACWYEIKYPEREIEHYKGIRYDYFKDVKKLSNVMNIRELEYRLTKKQLCLLKSDYRASDTGLKTVYINGKKDRMEPYISIRIKYLDFSLAPFYYFKVIANPKTGIIEPSYDLKKLIGFEAEITLDELLKLLQEKYENKLDLSVLKACVYNHECDVKLRDKVLELVTLKLMYSKTSNFKSGYVRAKRYLGEFKKNLGIDISLELADKLIKQHEHQIEKWHGIEIDDSESSELVPVENYDIVKNYIKKVSE